MRGTNSKTVIAAASRAILHNRSQSFTTERCALLLVSAIKLSLSEERMLPRARNYPPRSACEVEYVSIIDPRHALYGQRLRLVQVAHSGKEETSSCTVELCADVWRRIPLSVTDLGRNQPVLYPLPLSLTVMRQLLELFRRLEIQCQEGTSDENKGQPAADSIPKRKQRTKSSPTATLATAEPRATTDRLAEHPTNLLANAPSDRSTKAGGGTW